MAQGEATNCDKIARFYSPHLHICKSHSLHYMQGGAISINHMQPQGFPITSALIANRHDCPCATPRTLTEEAQEKSPIYFTTYSDRKTQLKAPFQTQLTESANITAICKFPKMSPDPRRPLYPGPTPRAKFHMSIQVTFLHVTDTLFLKWHQQ